MEEQTETIFLCDNQVELPIQEEQNQRLWEILHALHKYFKIDNIKVNKNSSKIKLDILSLSKLCHKPSMMVSIPWPDMDFATYPEPIFQGSL